MEQDLERALELNEQWRNRPVIALTQYEYARWLRRRGAPGDTERADALAAEALATADALGMPVIRRGMNLQ
jgi:hypothetical protein